MSPFHHLQHVRFQAEILVLPHVLKQMNTSLLSPEEAMVEAAGTGQIEWLNELLKGCTTFALEAVEAAATNGHLKAFQVLYDADWRFEDKISRKAFEALIRAVLATATKGYANVVEHLLALLDTFPTPFAYMYEGYHCSIVRRVFAESAANGHVEVLKIMLEVWTTKRHMKTYSGRALSRAIAGQHAHVVDFLLEKHEFDWNLMDAFEEAVARAQTATAEKIYNAFPQLVNDETKNLFVALALDGRKNAVEYLFNNGRRDPALVSDAFEAATFGFLDVAIFLHDTGLVSSEAFRAAWVCAATWASNSETVLYLYRLKRVIADDHPVL
jgi:hypothetical protein